MNNMQDFTTTTRPGYMGAVSWEGNNSRRNLYGSQLSTEIRNALKSVGIKGVTIACKTYTGGESISITIKASADDFVTLEEFQQTWTLKDAIRYGWITDPDTNTEVPQMCIDEWDAEKERRAVMYAAEREYGYFRHLETCRHHRESINEFCFDKYTMFTEAFRQKLHLIKKVVDSFNYDDSNSMYDYFDRGFYESYFVKVAC